MSAPIYLLLLQGGAAPYNHMDGPMDGIVVSASDEGIIFNRATAIVYLGTGQSGVPRDAVTSGLVFEPSGTSTAPSASTGGTPSNAVTGGA